jgi:hypothetical protein
MNGMNEQYVRLKNSIKFTINPYGDSFALRYHLLVLLKKDTIGNCYCAIDNDESKCLWIDHRDINSIENFIKLRAQDGFIYDVSGFIEYQGEITGRSLQQERVVLAKYRSWGFANNITNLIWKVKIEGAFYAEFPEKEEDYPYSNHHKIHPVFNSQSAEDMKNWKLSIEHEWVHRFKIFEYQHQSNANLRKIIATNIHGYGSVLTYEGQIEDFHKESYIKRLREIQDKIAQKSPSLFLEKYGHYDLNENPKPFEEIIFH